MSLKLIITTIFTLFYTVTLGSQELGARSNSPELSNIDYILVEKKARNMKVYYNGKLLKVYKIALGPNSVGHKIQEGDKKTPEGVYQISNKNPSSRFYRSLRVSYPNDNDCNQAKKKGVNPGGDIMLHGLGRGFGHLGKLHRLRDWTLGCIAVTDEEISEIFSAVEPGTMIEIRP